MTQKQQKPISKAYIEDTLNALRQPAEKIAQSFASVEDVKKAFSLPVTLGLNTDDRLAMDSAFSCGYDQMFSSLTQHGADLGQYPMTGFVGYGVLQQIAQNGMIRTCIQTVADDITREWIEVTGGDDTDPAVIDLISQNLEKLKVKSLYNNGVATMGYMGGAFIYIRTNTDDPSLPLQINDSSAELQKGSELELVLIDPVNVSPGEYNASDPLKSDYMSKPKYWWVLGQRVHSSRLIMLRDNLPPTLLRPAYNFLGIPQAQILWDYVMHWNKARVSVAGILEKLNLMVFQTNTEDLLSTAEGVQQLDAKMLALTRYRNNDSVIVCDKNVEDIKNITLTISGVTDVVRQALEFIAAINRTPAVKLLGISPSGFNATGESDIRNYYDHVRSKQELLRDGIQKIIDAVQLVTTGTIDPSITFNFKQLGSDDSASDTMTANTKVQMLNSLLQTNVISAEEARQAVKMDDKTGLSFIDDELPEPNEGADMGDVEGEGGQMDLASLMQQMTAKEPEQAPTPQPQQMQRGPADADTTEAQEA